MKRALIAVFVTLLSVAALSTATGSNDTEAGVDATRNYIVVLKGKQQGTSFTLPNGATAAQVIQQMTGLGASRPAGLSQEEQRGLVNKVGVLLVQSSVPTFAEQARAALGVVAVGEDLESEAWKLPDSAIEFDVSNARIQPQATDNDPLQIEQWSMNQIRAPRAHRRELGDRNVEVGIIDSGIDSAHQDFDGPNGTNVDVGRGRDYTFMPVGTVAQDNQFHGTHVAGIVAAQVNNFGTVGVAPEVTLVPIKACEASGFCFFTPVFRAIVYAGDIQLDVINMSLFIDDTPPASSTEFKCRDDNQQLSYIKATQRAINYARAQGVVPVAALGNSDTDLSKSPSGKKCDVIPAETRGVVGVSATERFLDRASYSNGGLPFNDVAAPGGNSNTGDCEGTVLSTLPGNTHGCISGTSMASPHAAGVVALIMSRFGEDMAPANVIRRLKNTTVDLGESGIDRCFGPGRIDAVRAVQTNPEDIPRKNADCAPFGNDGDTGTEQ